jgi:hypothetical protein
MNVMERKPAGPRRPVRPALLAVAAAAVMLLGACSAEPGTGGNGAGGNSAAVQLNPPSGPESSSPTWSTSRACPGGYQGSGIFRIVQPNGYVTSISQATNIVNAPFHGTLLTSIAIIQDYVNIPNGGTAELVIICFAGDSLTGNRDTAMSTYITFSSDGKTYTSSSTPPAGFTEPATPNANPT